MTVGILRAGKNKKASELIYSRKQAGNINKWNQKQVELKQPEDPVAPSAMSKSSANSTPIRNPSNPVHRISAPSAQKTHVLTSISLVLLYLAAATTNGTCDNGGPRDWYSGAKRNGRIRAWRPHLIHLLALSTPVQGGG